MVHSSLQWLVLSFAIILGAIPTGIPCTKQVYSIDCGYAQDERALLNQGWKKIFEEQFENGLDHWQVWNGGAYNRELQLYQSANLNIKDGILSIAARKETVQGYKLPNNKSIVNYAYSSGRIESKRLFGINAKTPKLRILARIKLPLGYGLWPAFWAYGKPYPSQGEIDFMEARGAETHQYLTNYFEAKLDDQFSEDHTTMISVAENLSDCYHIFEMEWTKDSLISYFDGKLVDIKKNDPHIASLFGKRQQLVLNLAIGGGFYPSLDIAKIQTGTMLIDWVKVYASK